MKYIIQFKSEYNELFDELLKENNIKKYNEDCFIPLYNLDDVNNGITIISSDTKNDLNGFGNNSD